MRGVTIDEISQNVPTKSWKEVWYALVTWKAKGGASMSEKLQEGGACRLYPL